MNSFVADYHLLHFNMGSLIPSSTNNVSLTPAVAFKTRKSNFLSRRSIVPNLNRQTLSAQKHTLPFSTSIRLFPQSRIGCILKPRPRTHIASASGTDVALEEADLSPAGNEASASAIDAPEISGEQSAVPTDISSIKTKRSRPARKSEMPPVKNEELIPGATFTGKVKSIQPFGAFVDFGAFTDGLVHVSRLSDSFVKDVANVVTVGQEVTVRLIEANMEMGRISLSMRESDDPSKVQQQRDAPVSSDTSKPPRRTSQKFNQKRDETKKSTRFVKGQDLAGTVKNLTRAGAFISLPEGEEGFLPASEENVEGFGNFMGGSSLEVGQEVSVRVLRITRGQVTLTMKKDEDVLELDSKLNQGVVHTATNPFVLAFRSNKVISAFLDERENENSLVEKAEEIAKGSDTVVGITDDTSSEALVKEEDLETIPQNSEVKDDDIKSITEVEVSSVVLDRDGSPPTEDQITEEPSLTEAKENEDEAELSGKVADFSSEIVQDAKENAVDDAIMKDGEQNQIPDTAEDQITEEPSSIEPKENKDEAELSGKVADFSSEIVQDAKENAVDDAIMKDGEQNLNPDTAEDQITEEPSPIEAKENKDEAELSGKVADFSSEIVAKENAVDDAIMKDGEQNQIPDTAEDQITEGPSPIEAKENKDETELSGEVADFSFEIVQDAKENAVDDAIMKDDEQNKNPDTAVPSATQSDSELSGGPLSIQESENEGEPKLFGELTDQASTDIAEEVTLETTEGILAEDGDQSEKIDSTSVAQGEEESATFNAKENGGIVSAHEAKSTESLVSGDVSENLAVHTAVNEMETQNSVDTEQNRNTANVGGQSSNASPEEPIIKAAISPAVVKQLREETGAGIMDCKNALSETGGDIAKAHEYLRKKGLASADKKPSRATVEGRIGSYIHDSRIGVLIEVNCETDFVARGDIFRELVEDLAMQVAAYPQVQYLNIEDVSKEFVDKETQIISQMEDLLSKPEKIRSKIVDGRVRKRLEELALLEQPFIKDDKVAVKDWVKKTISVIGENIKVKRFLRYNLGEGLQKKSQDFAAEVAAQTASKPVSVSVNQEPPPPAAAAAETIKAVEEPPKVAVSAALVKQLREETGAGMMDCKKALTESGGNLEKAQEYLRKKGLSSADKKSSRVAAEGRIGSYIHDSRIGVLIEVNCETDFVGRSENFKELVDDLAMQVVACPQVQYVSIEDIPESFINKEKELEMQREDLQSKPENIREKIVDGRVTKRLEELSLLEQPYIKNDSMLVKDLVKQTVAALGENIKVRRFVRFTLGEISDAKVEK